MRFVKVIALVAVVAGVIAVSASGFAIIVDTLPIGEVGTPYKYVPEIHGGGAPFAFSLEGGTLPQGITIRSDDGCICGTPQQSGTFVFNILGLAGTDHPPPQRTDSPDFTLHVRPHLAVTTTSLPAGFVGKPYSATLTAADAGGLGLTWVFIGGSLPPGLTMAADGTITGTPTTLGSYTFIVAVHDQDGGPRFDEKTLSMSVVTPLSAATPTPPAAEVGKEFALTLSTTGGLAPLTWAVTGLPEGLVLDPATAAIGGKPLTAGTFPVTATITDAAGQTATVNFTITVAPKLEITTLRLRGGAVAKHYAFTVRAVGGIVPRTWSSSVLPKGLRLGTSTGVLSGTPRRAGTFRVRVTVTDELKAVSTKVYRLTLLPAPKKKKPY